MASPAILQLDNFQKSFYKVYQGIMSESPQWKTDLKQLTDETKKMLGSAEKSAGMKEKLLSSISQLSEKELDPKKAKEALLSIFSGIDEMQANLMKLKTPEAIASEMQKKVEAVFTSKAQMPRVASGISTGRNIQILGELAAQQQSEHKLDGEELAKKVGRQALNPFALVAPKQLIGEIQFKFASRVHNKAIENIQGLSSDVEKLMQNTTVPLSYQELQQLLNEARGGMQTAQDIIIDLSAYDDLNAADLKKQVQSLKDKLEVAVVNFSQKMDALIGSEKCEQAMEDLEARGSEEDKEQFNTTIDVYQQTGTRAIALVKVEKDVLAAENELKQVTEAPDKKDISGAQKAILTTSIALEQTSKALTAFTEISAALPATKKANPLLAKLRNAQKKLVDQSKVVLENPELKQALEQNPEAKKVFQDTVVRRAETAVLEVKQAVEAIDNPTQNVEFSVRQKEFFAFVQKTIAEESKLEGKLKTDITKFAQRAIPLMRIQELKQLSKADSFSISYMMIDYINVLNYIYEKLEDAGKKSPEECRALNGLMSNDGIHDLAKFMADEYYPEFIKLKPEIQALVGTELLSEFNAKLNKVWDMADKVKGILKS
ncbi:MAG: hypothetical protein JSS60_07840 [Verrucomicrobia bacterium]|nr:hypothetical protein [Verrucomicrobiota bacterium]